MEFKNKSPLFHALKMINLASSLISLVLVQNAILSFANTDMSSSDSHLAKMSGGLIGIFTGSLALALGIIMMIRIHVMQKKSEETQ